MRRLSTLAAAAMAMLLGACGPAPVTKVVTFRLETSTSEQRAAAARVLAARYDGYRPSSSTPLETRVLEDSVVIEFRGEAPDDADLQSFGATQGVLRVSPADAKHILLFSDLDVEEATTMETVGGMALSIRLTERAGARMADFTKRNLGRLLVTTLDRKEVSRARINGTFGRDFQTTGLGLKEARDLGILLRHGRLPVAVTKVDIQHISN
jgi:preprotein translocase subunit SecD